MSCRRTEKLIPLYVEGDLGDRKAAMVRSHLDSCSTCRTSVGQYEASQEWLRYAPAPEVDAAMLENLRGEILAGLSKQNRWGDWLRMHTFCMHFEFIHLGAALSLAIAVGLVSYLSKSDSITKEPTRKTVENTSERPSRDDPTGFRGEGVPHVVVNNAKPRRLPAHHTTPHKEPDQPAFIARTGEAGREIESPAPHVRIEFQTSDPNIRIIWFAGAENASLKPTPED